jgi:glycine cleavage system H protein
LNEGDVFGTVEAVKTVADLYMPVSGKIIELNEALEATPENVNNDPYQSGWMIKIKVSDSSEFDALMDLAAYKELVA